MKKQGSAVWHGTLKEGKGSISTQTGVLRDAPYGFKARFEEGPGTNPEELIGAAHAGCYSMALAMQLSEAGHVPARIDTSVEITLEKQGQSFAITASHIIVRADVPGLSSEQFLQVANRVKEECVVSKALKVPISLDAELSNAESADLALDA